MREYCEQLYPYNRILFANEKENEVLIHARTEMETDNTLQRSQSQKTLWLHGSILCECPERQTYRDGKEVVSGCIWG